MSLRVLHVLESLAAGGMETTFLNMLAFFRESNPDDCHDVVAFAGGALEARYRAVANSVVIDPRGPKPEALNPEPDVIHILFERCAYRLLPSLLAHHATPIVYGKGYDMGGMYRLNEGLDWTADLSMLAACDGVTFTTSNLAEGFGFSCGAGLVRPASRTRQGPRHNRVHVDGVSSLQCSSKAAVSFAAIATASRFSMSRRSSM